jgi:hypothetical protein
MALKLVFNPFTGKFDYINAATATATIPELTSDPVSPTPEEAWVLHEAPAAIGSPIGLLLSLTHATSIGGSYQFSYYTTEGTIKRVTLT